MLGSPNDYPQYGGGQQSNFYHSIKGLAITCAIVSTIFATPVLIGWSEEFIKIYIIETYGHDLKDIGLLVWKALCFAFVFFLARAFAVAMLAFISIALVQRMPFLAAA